MPCTRPDFDGALFNFRIFLKLGGPTCLGPGASFSPPPPLSAALIVLGDLSDELKERLKKQIPNDSSKTLGLYSVCSIVKDAKYDLTTTVSVVDGMTNGAECIIKKVDYRVPGSTVHRLNANTCITSRLADLKASRDCIFST